MDMIAENLNHKTAKARMEDRETVRRWMEFHGLEFADLDIDGADSVENLNDEQVADLMESVEEDRQRDRRKGMDPDY
jgi:hypothetical protein